MQAFQNLFSILSSVARPFHVVDARTIRRGLAICAIGAFFVVTLAAFALSAAQEGLGERFGMSRVSHERVGFQPGQEIASFMYRGHIGR